MPPNSIEKDIITLLEKHPEGMKISDISRSLKIPRQTISKYVYGLKVAGLIGYREFGRAKLCFMVKKRPKGLMLWF